MRAEDDADRFVEDESASLDSAEDAVFGLGEDEEESISSALEDGPYSMPDPEAESFQVSSKTVSFANADTPEERIDRLFEQMPTHQATLYEILDMCEQPIAVEDLDARVLEIKEHRHSVFSSTNFCDLLEEAGAVIETDEEGAPLSEFEQEPLRVEKDGIEYWRVAPAPPVFWSVTAAGTAKLETYRPLEWIRQCYEAEPEYQEIFTTVLRTCSREGGVSVKDLGDLIDDEPVVQKPRRYAMYFIDKLEHAGALDWNGAWNITEPGRDYLDTLGGE